MQRTNKRVNVFFFLCASISLICSVFNLQPFTWFAFLLVTFKVSLEIFKRACNENLLMYLRSLKYTYDVVIIIDVKETS